MNHTFHRHVLPNGISLVIVPLTHTAAVTAIVFMGVGSRHESDAQRGLAHFTEHMVFKGGKKFTTTQAIAQSLDAVGGEFNAFTSHEFTGFYTKTAAEHLELGLDILSDMTLHATFPADELEKEKGVIIEEINMYEDMPMRKVDQVLNKLLFGDVPLGRAILGTKKTVSAFTREDFVKYREQFYFGAECTIVIAGAVDEKKAIEMVENFFGEMPKGESYKPVPAVIADAAERVLIEKKESEQTHLMLAVKAYPAMDPRRYAFRVLATILGGNMSSRLFVSVREEQGLCYYVRAHPDSYMDVGTLVASAGVDNNRLPQAVEAIMKELRHMRENPVTDEELNRAKQYIAGKVLLSMEDSENLAEFYGLQDLLEHEHVSPEESIEKIKGVTKDEVFKVAQELFVDDALRLAVIGPQDNASTLNSLLTFNS
jgi:predicted Zn-dependent peptidase